MSTEQKRNDPNLNWALYNPEKANPKMANLKAHAEKLAVSLREIIDMPRNERNAIDLLARVEKALVAYEEAQS